MEGVFRFKRFSVSNSRSALKVGTDAVLLGAAMTIMDGDRTALDVGTGTGVIALMAAQRCGGAIEIEAIDIDPPSAGEAAENFASSPWAASLGARCVALQDYSPCRPLDLIFSNPPYYDESLRNPDPRTSAARHTGSLSYRDICAFASGHLAPEGRLSLILPAGSAAALRRTAASFGLFPFRQLGIRTTPTKPVGRVIMEFSRTRPEGGLREEELVLQDGNGRSAAYGALTSEFYL